MKGSYVARAKYFKEFNRKFSHFTGKYLEGERVPDRTELDGCNKWPFLYMDNFSGDEIHHAVYEAADASDWQKFRVSMKTMTTREKIYRLGRRWLLNTRDDRLEVVRIMNYLSALKRGGLLNRELEVIK